MLSPSNPLLLYGLFVFVLGTALQAADPPKDKGKMAVTDSAKADVDFAYQGEYLGHARGSDGCDQYTGVQVVALGDGKFDIYHLTGGLPGAGWDRQSKTKLSGELKAGVVVGKNDQLSISITAQEAVVSNPAGQELTKLEHIRRVSPTTGATPPANAIVLFDGSTPTNLDGAKLTADGLLEIGSTTKMPVQDFQLHVEFRTPYMPYARGQGRGNSGVYIQQRYELQVLDSFGLEGVHNECGGIYQKQPPDVNMCLPPLAWQTYDIHFTAARWDSSGNKIGNARITVYHNGEPIHLNRELPSKTGAGQKEAPEARPIHFQNHGNPVNFRNMWIVLNSPQTCEAVCSPTCQAAVECPANCTTRPACSHRKLGRCPSCR